MCISNFIPSINCGPTYWYFSGLVPFCLLSPWEGHPQRVKPSPPVLPRATASLSLPHRVSLHPFANDLACLHIVTCSLRTHSSTVGRLAAHSPRPLHLIVPTLTWRIENDVSLIRAGAGRGELTTLWGWPSCDTVGQALPSPSLCVSGARSYPILEAGEDSLAAGRNKTDKIGGDLPLAASWRCSPDISV